MTEKEKDLLFKDLCARVPYGVKYMKYSWGYGLDQEIPEVEVLECVDKNGYISNTKVYTVEDIKPYLFPLSSMTEEQKEELQSLIIQDAFGTPDNTYTLQDFYCKYHLDYRGLIEKDLALDATNLNIY